MTAYTVDVLTRPRRRTHLSESDATGRANTWCGLNVPTHDAHTEPLQLVGGATMRMRNDLVRTLGPNTCKRCTLIAMAMLVLYAARDAGKAI